MTAERPRVNSHGGGRLPAVGDHLRERPRRSNAPHNRLLRQRSDDFGDMVGDLSERLAGEDLGMRARSTRSVRGCWPWPGGGSHAPPLRLRKSPARACRLAGHQLRRLQLARPARRDPNLGGTPVNIGTSWADEVDRGNLRGGELEIAGYQSGARSRAFVCATSGRSRICLPMCCGSAPRPDWCAWS
jgi:hypothetical protein